MIELKVLEKKDNPLLERTDLMLSVKHSNQPTPKKEEVAKAISGEFKADVDKIVVNYIFTETGSSESKVKAKIYKGKPPVRKAKKIEKKAEEKPKEETKVEKKEPSKPEKEKPEAKEKIRPKEEKKGETQTK